MGKYYCFNCAHFRTRVITKRQLAALNKQMIKEALKDRDVAACVLSFPLSLVIYKRVAQQGACKILFCAQNLLKRDSYIDRGNAETISSGTEPCPRYDTA